MVRLLDRWHERLFSTLHRHALLYNACWEDPAVDRQALALTAADRVFVITSGGCNALDYVLAGAGSVVAVDVNARQTALLDLKLASVRTLDFEDHWRLFGEGVHPQFLHLYRTRLRPVLPLASQAIWDRQQAWFDPAGGGLYRHGLAGVIARGFQWWSQRRPALRHGLQELLAAPSLSDQQRIWRQLVRPHLDDGLLNWALRRRWFSCLCGVPVRQWEEVERAGGNMATFTLDALDRVFTTVSLSTNYFYQVYLRGHYTPACCPAYLTVAGWRTLHDGAWARVATVTESVTAYLATESRPFTRFVLLDHLDWLADHQPAAVAEEWDRIRRRAAPRALAIWRSAHAEPAWMGSLGRDGRPLAHHWQLHHEFARRLQHEDRVGTYRGFHIATLVPAT